MKECYFRSALWRKTMKLGEKVEGMNPINFVTMDIMADRPSWDVKRRPKRSSLIHAHRFPPKNGPPAIRMR